MLDTVAIKTEWPIICRLPQGHISELAKGIKGKVSGYLLKSVEFSLPKILYGGNGHVIETQPEIDEALKAVRARLEKIAVIPEPESWAARRVDLAWNYDLAAAPVILAHSGIHIPQVRNGASIFNADQGMAWRGAKSDFMLRLYDKAAQMRVKGRSVLRVEVSLKGPELKKYLSGSTWMNWMDLWTVYRGILSSIPPIVKPQKTEGLVMAVAKQPANVRADILAALATSATKRSVNRYRKLIEAQAAGVTERFSWADFLSVDGPPPAIHVTKNYRRK